MDNIKSEDVCEFFFLQTKLKQKAIEICDAILKELGDEKRFDPEMDKIEFILDKTTDLNENGELETIDFPLPSVQIKEYSEDEKEYKTIIEFPATWLKDKVDYIKAMKEMKEMENRLDERFFEYHDRLEERLRREEIHLKAIGDIDPHIDPISHSDLYIELSEKVEKELKESDRFKDLPPTDYTEGLKQFIRASKQRDDYLTDD